MVSSFQSSVSDNQTANSRVTNPIEYAKQQEEAKKAKIKADQDSRAKSLFIKLEEQRKVYDEVKKAYYKSQSDNTHFKNQTKLYENSEYIRNKRQKRYEKSTIEMNQARYTRDVELRRLEDYTSNYCSAQNLATQISIFMN